MADLSHAACAFAGALVVLVAAEVLEVYDLFARRGDARFAREQQLLRAQLWTDGTN